MQDSANQVAEPARAAQAKAAAAKEARRQKFVASGPVRKSSRAGAAQTAARLQAQAEGHRSDDELSGPASSREGDQHSDSDSAAEGSDMSSQGTKRKRGAEEEFDPAGSIMQLVALYQPADPAQLVMAGITTRQLCSSCCSSHCQLKNAGAQQLTQQ